MTQPGDPLYELAAAYGVSTEFWDWQGRLTPVRDDSIVAVLAALEVDASTPQSIAAALADLPDRAWRRTLPPVVVLRAGWTPWVPVHLPDGAAVTLELTCEDGTVRPVRQVDHWVPPRTVDGAPVGEATFELAGDLPLGWHTLTARVAGQPPASCPVVVTPPHLTLPPPLAEPSNGRGVWGLMAQLYQVRSRASWGLGDLADLATLVRWGAEQGADFVLVNPIHAGEPTVPVEPSPYLPTTRRFVNPLYIHVEDVPELAGLSSGPRAELARLATAARLLDQSELLDRDAVWTAKRAALRLLFDVPRRPEREADLAAFRSEQGRPLLDFATWCALVDAHGPDPLGWPAGLADPDGAAVPAFRAQHRADVDFHGWLQWVADSQLRQAQTQARTLGMAVGVVHDLAVGVHPNGADVWALGSALASGVSVGAPPDQFNQLGQDWSQPPWRPDRLAELGYAPFRDMVRTALRHAGGLRVDHILGLFRLWWVPSGRPADQGTYVRYDHEALVGILALEAHRAGALVVGEDLGTVEPWVRDYLAERGVLGTSVLWFERDYQGSGQPLPPAHYRRATLASVTTHDLPPTRGYLDEVHVRIRAELGLLTRPVEQEHEQAQAERAAIVGAVQREGLLAAPDARDVPGGPSAPDGPVGADGPLDEQDTLVLALHRYLARSNALLVGVALADLAGDRRPVNQPGTDRQYPNWRLPLAGSDGRPVLLEEVVGSARARTLAQAARR